MGLATLMTRPCQVINVTDDGPPDEYGNPSRVDGAPVDTVCYIQERQASEDTVLEDLQSQLWLVLLPAVTEIAGTDRVIVPDADLTLEVVGPPWPVQNPRTQATHHIELHAKQVT